MRIELPTGQIAEFPDDMPMSEIEAVLQRQFPVEPKQAIAQAGQSAAEDDVLGVSAAGVEMPTEFGRTQAVRQFAQGMTFGTSDELESALTGKPVQEIRKEMKQYKEDRPGAAMSAEIMGMAMSPAQLLKLPKALQGMSTTAQAATKAGTGGFAYGAGTAEGSAMDRIEQGAAYAVPSALFGAGGQMLINKIGNKTVDAAMKASADNPTVANLKTARDKAYDVVDASRTVFGKDSYDRIFNAANTAAKEAGFTGSAADPMKSVAFPNLTKMIALVDTHATQAMSLKQLDKLRNRIQGVASQAFKKGDTDEYIAIKNVVNDIDDMVEQRLAAAGDDSMKVARAAHARYAKARDINDALLEAKTQAKVTGSGGNTENLMRQAVNRILKNKNTQKFYTDEEREVMRKFAAGDLTQDVLRLVGKLSPTDSGLMLALQTGAMVTDPVFATTAAGGYLAKRLAESRIERKGGELISKLGGVTPTKPAAPAPLTTSGGVMGAQGLMEFLGVAP
jgi:hypothetical protein